MIKGVIFDFDGLILETEASAFEAYSQTFRNHGVHLQMESWVRFVGGNPSGLHILAYLEELLGRRVDRDAVQREVRNRHNQSVQQLHVLPGVLEHIQDAQDMGLALGVASSSSRDWVEGHLRRLGLRNRFEVVRTRDDVEHVKPAPDLFLAVLGALGLAPGEVIAYEDSPHGITAAKAAGLFCVAVPNAITAHLHLAHADRVVASLAETSLQYLVSELSLSASGPSTPSAF